jgi:hypothetical protein
VPVNNACEILREVHHKTTQHTLAGEGPYLRQFRRHGPRSWRWGLFFPVVVYFGLDCDWTGERAGRDRARHAIQNRRHATRTPKIIAYAGGTPPSFFVRNGGKIAARRCARQQNCNGAGEVTSFFLSVFQGRDGVTSAPGRPARRLA